MLHDVAVVGAGPVGATLALALSNMDLDIVVVDARQRGETLRGDRTLALSHGARLIFERLGIWAALSSREGAVTPIVAIDISQAGGFGRTRLSALEHGLPALGYVVSYRALQSALDAALARTSTVVRHGATVVSVGGTTAYAAVEFANAGSDAVTARLAAVADGSGAAVAGIAREHRDYEQVALIAEVWRATEQSGVAYERFTAQGPIALLPQGDHYGLIWTMTPQRALQLVNEPDDAFIAELARSFGPRLGSIVRIAERRTFPLVLQYAREIVAPRVVVLGNAAQTLHPVAGQGFNLGLRDAFELAQTILDARRDDIGVSAMLRRYAAGRRRDRTAGILFTNSVVSAFGSDLPLLRWPRGLALTLLDTVPGVKRAFTRAMLFGVS